MRQCLHDLLDSPPYEISQLFLTVIGTADAIQCEPMATFAVSPAEKDVIWERMFMTCFNECRQSLKTRQNKRRRLAIRFVRFAKAEFHLFFFQKFNIGEQKCRAKED